MKKQMDIRQFKKYAARSLYPDRAHELLFGAALFDKDRATDCWRSWKKIADLDSVPYEGFRVLPLLYKNLRQHGVEDPDLARLKGIYRYSWVKNRRSLAILGESLGRLREAGIPSIVLKGAGLILTTYRDYGARYMDDCDFLIPIDAAPRAIALFQEWGWWPSPAMARLFRPYVNGVNLDYHHKLGLDLHWHLLTQRCSPAEDAPFWEGKLAIDFEGIPASVLNPTDQLFHICINGSYWSVCARLNWISDAYWQIQTHGAKIDWNRLLAIASSHQLSLQLWITLDYLRERFSLPIPNDFLRGLQDIPRGSRETKEFLSCIRRRAWLSELPPLWHRFHRHEISRRYPIKIWGFMKYLESYCGLESAWALPRDLAKRLLNRAGQNIKAPKKAEQVSNELS